MRARAAPPSPADDTRPAAARARVGMALQVQARASPANCPMLLAAMRTLHWQPTVTAATAGGAYIPAAAAER